MVGWSDGWGLLLGLMIYRWCPSVRTWFHVNGMFDQS